MTTTYFIDQVTPIPANWLNDVNTKTYADPEIALLASSAGANNVGYQPAGTGAVARTVQNKLDETPSANDFGVIGTGGDDSTKIQLALDSGDYSVLFTTQTNLIGKPLLIKNGTARVSLHSNNRVNTILQPNAVSIAQAPQNINALIINQDNNPHFCMENMRMYAALGYTGVGIYSVEGGGSDGSGQCIYSGIFRNLWIDFPSTNAGFLTGGTQNTVFDTVTCENMKGIFNLQGAGNGDNFYKSFSLFNCFDQFIYQKTDTGGSFDVSVDGLHAYNHQRGRLFDVQNWAGGNINDVILEPAAGNLGTTGLFKFTNSSGLLVSNFQALTRSGVPACATGIELSGVSGKFMNGAINAETGVRFTGTSAVDVEFVNVDFTNVSTACLHITSNITGNIRTRGCKFNVAVGNCFLNQAASSNNWLSYNDEFINAGQLGLGGARNISVSTSGQVVLVNPRIGRDNGSANANYWIFAGGTGTVDIYNPVWVGSPPVGLLDPTSTQVVNIHYSQPTKISTQTAATYTVVDSDQSLTANFAGTVTYTLPAPSGFNIGRRLNFRTITANTVVSASANVAQLATGAGTVSTAILSATAGKWAELVSDGTYWQIIAAN